MFKNFRTIYIVTNADKTILSAFTSEEEAKKEIDFKYQFFLKDLIFNLAV